MGTARRYQIVCLTCQRAGEQTLLRFRPAPGHVRCRVCRHTWLVEPHRLQSLDAVWSDGVRYHYAIVADDGQRVDFEGPGGIVAHPPDVVVIVRDSQRRLVGLANQSDGMWYPTGAAVQPPGLGWLGRGLVAGAFASMSLVVLSRADELGEHTIALAVLSLLVLAMSAWGLWWHRVAAE